MSEYYQALKRVSQTPSHLISELHANPGTDLLKYVEKDGRKGVYQFKKYVEKGGESLVVLAIDPYLDCEVIVKFAIPVFIKKEKRQEDYSQVWRSEPRKFLKESRESSINKEISERFTRASQYQRKMHMVSVKAHKSLFYVPDVYNVQSNQFVYCVQEYCECPTSMDWVIGKDEKQILLLWYKLVKSIKLGFHDRQPTLIHGDIKPDNILVSDESTPIIIDFSCTTTPGERRDSLTHRDTRMYSVYSSDHQIEDFHRRHDLDDIHALACTLWSWIKGYEPSCDDREYYRCWDIFRPSQLPRHLRDIFIKATSEKEKDKYSDISEMLLDIEKLIDFSYSQTVVDRKVIDCPKNTPKTAKNIEISDKMVDKYCLCPQIRPIIKHKILLHREIWQ